jgi:hypothetical protein
LSPSAVLFDDVLYREPQTSPLRHLRRQPLQSPAGRALASTESAKCLWRKPWSSKSFRSDKNPLPGKLAEAELQFTEGVLDGLKLIGFTIWERRTGNGRNVTFPARSYTVGGERRSFALLRPTAGEAAAQESCAS